MKLRLTSLTAACAVVLATISIANAEDLGPRGPGGRGPGHRQWGDLLQRLTEGLNLTTDQQAKVRPILEQAKPQMIAIRQEVMQKRKAVMEKTMSQVRAVLTPQQQQKLDAIQKAREDMRNAMKEMREARGQ